MGVIRRSPLIVAGVLLLSAVLGLPLRADAQSASTSPKVRGVGDSVFLSAQAELEAPPPPGACIGRTCTSSTGTTAPPVTPVGSSATAST